MMTIARGSPSTPSRFRQARDTLNLYITHADAPTSSDEQPTLKSPWVRSPLDHAAPWIAALSGSPRSLDQPTALD